MKKILIISCFTLPADVIASYRTMAYLKHFKTFGYEPTVLTHYGGMKAQKEVTFEDYEYGRIIRIPNEPSLFGNIVRLFERIPIINKISILARWAMGYLDASSDSIDSYYNMKAYCVNLLDIRQYDLMIGIFSPHHHLKLCYQLHMRFQIPYVLDFRDLWSNRIMARNYHPNITERFQDLLDGYYWKKWLSKALFFTITSEPWKARLERLTPVKGYLITNGFEEESFTLQPSELHDEFVVLHAGSLYEHQKINIFLAGVKQFIETCKPINFKVKFIGGDRSSGIEGDRFGFMHAPVKRIRRYLNADYCDVTHRVDKKIILRMMSSSQLLLFLGHSEIEGWYSGKIFDYLASRRPILLVPDDSSVVSKLIKETKSGFIANTPERVYMCLQLAYSQWKANGNFRYSGDEEEILKYSRKSQVKNMSALLDKHLIS
ncbi:glycosyltransferase family protein [Marinoscillum furvescens]|uniref:Glycosyltransferase involved in cell wall biosynthesis n=1 Tax=Marinoscillum furvescens DSM 4134 TaxID=1122208 RepID=A0A3D9L419_MARFU|nr:glycosyltransferase family 4 protein [Marinoscillum furvescens]RED99550.1 hypothetical protein C7460_108172 [Marinoscillum furvescens DSM 4134]